MRLSMDEVRKQHDGIKKLYEQGLRGATASVEQVLDLFDTIEALQQENEQLQELAQAKADGRLVVLPCKVGDTVYAVYGYLNKSIGTAIVKQICVRDNEIRVVLNNSIEKIWGRSVFATQEEAEKAIGGETERGKEG